MSDVPDGFPKFEKQTRPWQCRKDDQSCTRTKPCRTCLGARNKRSGQLAQRLVRKELEIVFGVPAAKFVGQLGNEETWQLPVRVEVKAGQQVQPIWRRFVDAYEQALADEQISGPLSRFRIYVPAMFTADTLVVCAGDGIHEALDAPWTGVGSEPDMTANKPFWTRHLTSEEQSNRSTAIGDLRPFLAAYSPPGTRINFYSFRLSSRTRMAEARHA